MRITLEPAFVLHSRPYRETSLLVDLFTEHHGRIAAVARGVRQHRSALKPLLQPFIPLFISWQGRSELMTLLTAEANGHITRFKGKNLLPGFYLNELLMRLLPKYDPHPTLYTIYHKTLLELSDLANPQKTLRLFEKNLLQELGYGLQLQQAAANKNLLAEKFYYYNPEQGFTVSEENTSNKNLFAGKSLLALAREELNDKQVLDDVKRLMRRALGHLLGQQPIHSRELYIQGKKTSNEEVESE